MCQVVFSIFESWYAAAPMLKKTESEDEEKAVLGFFVISHAT